MHGAWISFLTVILSCIDWYQTVDLWEFGKLLRYQGKNHEDDTYWKHLSVGSSWIDISIADGRNRDYQKVDHVVELVFLCRDIDIGRIVYIVDLVELPQIINLLYVVVLEYQHKRSKYNDSCE